MIGLLPPDRWTCPQCERTEVPSARDAEQLRRAIRRAQARHARRHAAELRAELDAVQAGVR